MSDLDDVKRTLELMESRFDTTMTRLVDVLSRAPAPSSQSTVSVNAGGLGVWVATTACAVMLAMNLCLLALLVNHDRKIDDLRHMLNAVYMMAPHLKPEKD